MLENTQRKEVPEMAFSPAYGNQYYYDVFPLVVAAGRETVIHVRPQGGRQEFVPGKTYTARFLGQAGGSPDYYPASCDVTAVPALCGEDGGFEIPFTFAREQQYVLRLEDEGETIQRFQLYCVADDLVGLYPFLGDLHIHTTCSDGHETPEVVCANYRAHGYDFMTITDHARYYPSLRAMKFYQDVPTELTIVPGEEVHMPTIKAGHIEPHIVNFGGRYSINALVNGTATGEVGTGWETRSLTPDCPPVMTNTEFGEMIEGLMAKTEVPAGVDALQAAGTRWVFDEIRRAGGLSIYPHPTWITDDVYHVPDALHKYLIETRPFDAFEVLGGEKYYEQNGFQTVSYYEDREKGHQYPVVGSTDSHCSNKNSGSAHICSTIIFSKENERQALIDAVRDFRSVAVDTISWEFRLVGHLRLVRYACFLLKNYFPRHDRLCREEGEMMLQYAVGTEEEKQQALAVLKAIHGRVQQQRGKYFAF